MQTSASYWMFEGGLEGKKPVRQAMAEAKAAGFDAIELCIAATGALTHETSRAECEDLAGAAHEIGIAISSVASGQSWEWSPSANDPAVRRKIVDFTVQALRRAAWLGADAYLFVPGAVSVFFLPNAEIVPYDLCYERSTAAVREILPTAEETGVALSIENVWNKFLLSPLEMRDFIDAFDSPALGAYFDVGNVLLTGYPDQWIRILGPRIRRVHIKDYKTSVGTAAGFVDLLEGDVDFDAVRGALSDVGYDGYVTAELIPYEPGRPRRTAEAMRRIFG